MQLHQVAARSFSYTVHDGSLQADRHRRGDYVTAFHLLAPFFPGLAGVAVMWHMMSLNPITGKLPVFTKWLPVLFKKRF